MFENYVKEPEAEQLIHRGLVKTAFVNVKHKGFKTLTGRKMFYGPDRFAWMRGLSHIPASEFTLKSSSESTPYDTKQEFTTVQKAKKAQVSARKEI